MADKDPDLKAAYDLDGPAAVRDLYRRWADSYDTGFAATQGYCLPWAVANAFAAVDPGGAAPVLDVGAGTGLVGAALAEMQVGPVEATDLSEDMLRRAAAKDCYEACFAGDITGRLPVADCRYRGVISAGTFTHGHVGVEGLDEVLRVAAPGAWVVLSINEAHWSVGGFAAAFVALGNRIADLTVPQVRIFDDRADPAHRNDTSLLATFRRV